jgi:hypothetical protein
MALVRYTWVEDGRLFHTPECASLEEVEGHGHINGFYLLLLPCDRGSDYALSMTYAAGGQGQNGLYLLDVAMPKWFSGAEWITLQIKQYRR